jgi:hypothetical protein
MPQRAGYRVTPTVMPSLVAFRCSCRAGSS